MYNNYLEHYGVKGMHWGVRRYQNEDGTLTDVGRSRQNVRDSKADYKAKNKEFNKAYDKAHNYSATHLVRQYAVQKNKKKSDALWDDAVNKGRLANEAEKKYKQEKKRHRDKYGITIDAKHVETGMKIAGALLIGGAAIYGGKKLNSRLVSQMQKSALELGRKQMSESFKFQKLRTEAYNLADKEKIHLAKNGGSDLQKKLYDWEGGFYDRRANEEQLRAFNNLQRSRQNDFTLSEKANYLKNRIRDR